MLADEWPLLDALPCAVLYAREGKLALANPAAHRMFGPESLEALPGETGGLRAFHDNGREVTAAEFPINRILAGDTDVPELECRFIKPAGDSVWMRLQAAPVRGPDGAPAGATMCLFDITAEKLARDQATAMNRELYHRVNNALAIVQGVANMSARGARDIEAFREAFSGRVRALSKTQTLLVRHNWLEVPLVELLQTELDAEIGDGRVKLDGPDLALKSEVALALGLAVHELKSNATKYGSLSKTGGNVHFAWSAATEDRRVRLEWREMGGPSIQPPTHAGIGTHLLTRALAQQLGGSVELAYEPSGLKALITASL
ncbi:MAG: PAS domain S-box protein [Hyphomicrobiales bacterium]|nr:PAS domain S-box protein [Hyphomicrobiales bacterium]